jgi:hypothetical protein
MEDEMAVTAQQLSSRAWYARPSVWILGIVLLGLAGLGIVEMINRPAAIAYGDFLNQLDAGNVAGVTFAGTRIDGTFKQPVALTAAQGSTPQTNFRTDAPSFGDTTLLPELRKQHVAINVVSSSNWISWLGTIPWPMVLIIGALLIAGLVRLVRGDKTPSSSAAPAHPMTGLIAGLFGRKD